MSAPVLARGLCRAVASPLNASNDMWCADFTQSVLPPGIRFLRASSATFVDQAGTAMVTVGNDLPRFDRPFITPGPRGLMVEGSRSNLLLNSASLATQSVTVSATAYTLSFYGTGSITLGGAYSGVLNGTGVFPKRVSLSFTPTAGSLTLTVSGSVQYAQLAQGSFASSYIPTTTTAATRAADFPTITDLGLIGFNPAEGTWMLDTYVSPDSQGIPLGFSLDMGTQVRGQIQLNTTTTNMMCFTDQGQVSISAPPFAAGARIKAAGSYSFGPSGGSISLAANGVLQGVSSNVTMTQPPAFNTILLGHRRLGSVGQQWSYTPLASLAYLPQKMPDASLIALTTL